MRKAVLPLLLILSCRLAAQTPALPDPIATLRASARLVVVDVVVQDSHGHPIHGLTQSDFTLAEGKADQNLRAFEEHTPTPTAKLPAIPPMPPGVFTNYALAPTNSAVNVLLLDLLNTPMQDQTYVRAQLLKYLQTAQPGTRIAIFSLTDHLRMLQSFTTDPELLLRAIQRISAKSSPLLDNPGGTGAPASVADQVADVSGGLNSGGPSFLANLYDFEAENKSFQKTSQAIDTFSAMNALARYLAGIPGRKNLLWFSGSFPITILPDADAKGTAFAGQASTQNQFKETTNLLTRAQVAVYPIDALGIRTPEASRASAGDSSSDGGDRMRPSTAGTQSRAFLYDTVDAQNTMNQLAEDTGGKAFINTNGLATAASAAIEIGSSYYTLSYSPSNSANDGAYRPIRVKVDQPGLKLFYRRGYYADAPASGKSAAAAPTPGTLRVAALYGGPPATQIIFKALVQPTQPATAQPEPRPAEGNNVLQKSPTGWLRYAVNLAADTHHMNFTETPDGHYQDTIECITMVFTPDGTLINSVVSTTKANVAAPDYAELLREGLHVTEQISVPAKGDFALRIIVHDQSGDRVGSLELPLAAVRNLPPLQTR